MNHENVFFNRAKVENAESINCDNCFESLVFALRDSEGRKFTVGLTTMLECLKFAISQGELPKLPYTWGMKVDSRYDTRMAHEPNICYDDTQKE